MIAVIGRHFQKQRLTEAPTEKVVATKNFPNPDCIRYELHRVWVVQATLKPGLRHVYHKRMFYWDEDVPGTGTAENFDAAGKVYRIVSGIMVPFYEAPGGIGGLAGSGFFNSDLSTGVTAFSGFGGCSEKGCGWTPIAEQPDSYYSPEAMAGEGVR